MAPTPPLWSQTDLQNITAAIASGQLEIRFNDRTIRYRSIDDLVKAKSVVENYLFQQSADVPVRQIRIWTGDAWDN